MTRAGSEHGPVAAPLHNRIRGRAGLKNARIGNKLRERRHGRPAAGESARDGKPVLAAWAAGRCGDEVHRGGLLRIQPADV